MNQYQYLLESKNNDVMFSRSPNLLKTLNIKIVDHLRSQLQPGNDFLGCTSTQNLLDYIIKRATFSQLSKRPPILLENILSILIINPEPLVLTAFPSEDGWPVPKFYGSCGRLVFMENVGNPLSSVVDEPFPKRARMALQVLKIAKHFTRNDPNLALYLTDWSMDNFAVDDTGLFSFYSYDFDLVLSNNSYLLRWNND